MKLSIIIPTYNSGEVYLSECLDSIASQTILPHEVLVVNDGSTDNTEEILESYSKKYPFINYITIKNGGQGRARNLALKMISGDHIMFIDADDFIRSNTIERCEERIEKEAPDILMFDYNFYFEEDGRYTYPNKETFLRKGFMDDEHSIKMSCLSVQTMFTVNRIYKTSFILDNDIKFGEGYIYEDIEFWTHAAMKCQRLSMIYSPFYIIRINQRSTTKSNHDTDRHANDFITAIKTAKAFVDPHEIDIKKKFSKYVASKFLFYYKKRVPERYKRNFLKSFIDAISDYPIPPVKKHQFVIRGSRKLNASTRTLWKLYLNSKINPIKLVDFKQFKTKKISTNQRYYLGTDCVIEPIVLFDGFDHRYTGNSRYLFEQLISNDFPYNFYFATTNELVPDEYRVIPYSEKYFNLIYTSAVVIFESWINSELQKPKGKTWINLWHGTPYKKLLFDTNEYYICEANEKQKSSKFSNLEKMDYLITDNKYVEKYFKTAFFFNEEYLMPFGYPRVEYLIKNKNDEHLKSKIREKYGLTKDEKIISYLPTWRDYNYKTPVDEHDYGYLLDEEKFKDLLPNGYTLVSKGHPFGNSDGSIDDIETQELILISDCVITDYSSVMFDAFAIDIPVCIIEKDFEKYDEARGVYADIRKDLLPFITDSEENLAIMLKSYNVETKEYKLVKKKYCYENGGDLISFIENILTNNIHEYNASSDICL